MGRCCECINVCVCAPNKRPRDWDDEEEENEKKKKRRRMMGLSMTVTVTMSSRRNGGLLTAQMRLGVWSLAANSALASAIRLAATKKIDLGALFGGRMID